MLPYFYSNLLICLRRPHTATSELSGRRLEGCFGVTKSPLTLSRQHSKSVAGQLLIDDLWGFQVLVIMISVTVAAGNVDVGDVVFASCEFDFNSIGLEW